MIYQRTLGKDTKVTGIGLHSGKKVTMKLMPAEADFGIQFVRTDIPNAKPMKANALTVGTTENATTLGAGAEAIHTVEHLLGTLYGLGINNVMIEIDGPEVPIMDGSGASFVFLLKEAGIKNLNKSKKFLVILDTVRVEKDGKWAQFEPHHNLMIDSTIVFAHPVIKTQRFDFEFSCDTFIHDIARARTFGFARDVDNLKRKGLLLLQLPFLFLLSVGILVPLLMGLLRTSMGLQLKASKIALGRFRFYDFVPFMILLWGYAAYLSHSFKIGSIFFSALCLVFIFSTALIKTLQFVLRKYIYNRSLLNPTLGAGIAIRNFARSGHKLTLSFLSLAMGATLISLILQLDRMIQKEFTLDESKPSLFLFDIQEDQMEPLLDFAKKNGTPLEGITPMIRARMEKVNGEEFKRSEAPSTLRTREDEVENRFRNRGLNLTYRRHLSQGETLVEGEPFPEVTESLDRPAWVSVEKRFAQRLKLKLGDKVTFDVQGIEIEGIVRNFREVKWTSFYPNFFVNVEPGFIDEAPKTYLSVLPAGSSESKRKFQREAVSAFPNISMIDVEELTNKLSLLFMKSRLAIEVISYLSLGVGLVILYGLSHDQVYRRYYDLALMKSLGVSSSKLRSELILEFGALFFMAMGLGLFLGWVGALVIGKEVFKLSISVDWTRILVPFFSLSILCLVTILVSSWRALRAKPRELLSDA